MEVKVQKAPTGQPMGLKAKIQNKTRPKHIPQRICIACRTHDAKRGLVRVIRTPDGKVEVDETGKKNGRGAYMCRTHECWEIGLNRKALENALKTQIDPENRAQLRRYGEMLPGKSVPEIQETAVFPEGVRENAR